MFRLLIISLLTFGLAACSEEAPPTTAELPVLTVVGEIGNTNRPGRDDFADPLFYYRQIEFDNAHVFTYGDLAALPAYTLTAHYDAWGDHDVTAKGPRLTDVLDAAGATGTHIRLHAIDGYNYEFVVADLSPRAILAIQEGGAPLPLGGHGPVWLLMPPEDSPAGPESDEGLVWGVYAIEVYSGAEQE